MSNEIWKDIKGYEGLYQVSNLGRVKSLEKYVSNGYSLVLLNERILKPCKQQNGYMTIGLYKNKTYKRKLIHRLVWESFNGDIEDKMTVNHKDEDKTNNCIDNLEILTQAENNHYGTRDIRAKESMINGKNSKPCIAYNDNETIYYPSMMEAQRKGFFTNNISLCCRNKYGVLKNFYKGYYWKYA